VLCSAALVSPVWLRREVAQAKIKTEKPKRQSKALPHSTPNRTKESGDESSHSKKGQKPNSDRFPRAGSLEKKHPQVKHARDAQRHHGGAGVLRPGARVAGDQQPRPADRPALLVGPERLVAALVNGAAAVHQRPVQPDDPLLARPAPRRLGQ